MQITKDMAEIEIRQGLSAVCAWCEHWHNAKMRGSTNGCLVQDCGGLAVGRAFPEYKGVYKGNLHKICFICGRSADAVIDIGGCAIGVCNRMGAENETCLDKARKILLRQHVVAKEIVVPLVGEDTK